MGLRPGRARGLLLPLAAVLVALPLAVGYTWSNWVDMHVGYPPVPNGYSQIVNTFGQPCNSNAHLIPFTVRYADTGAYQTIYFHKKLGGLATAVIPFEGGTSTNLDNDIWGHLWHKGLLKYVKSGVGAYNCRYIAGTTKWSTHAWGIAIDISWNVEPNGDCTSNNNYTFAYVLKNHGWTWGADWCDPMHFQYATGY
jgi:hypothetical protein